MGRRTKTVFCAVAVIAIVVMFRRDADDDSASSLILEPASRQRRSWQRAASDDLPVSPKVRHRKASLPTAIVRTISEPYKWPVLPGTPEWKQKTWDQTPWSLCQIPDHILTNMTDAALLETCLKYPMRVDIGAFANPAEGLAIMTGRFNGLQEFLVRPSMAGLLKAHFESMTAAQLGVAQTSNDNHGFSELRYVSALLLHPAVMGSFSESEQAGVCQQALRLQAQMRQRYGKTASEIHMAHLAATLLCNGIIISTPSGDFDWTQVFSRDNPNNGATLTPTSIERLNEIGRQLLTIDR